MPESVWADAMLRRGAADAIRASRRLRGETEVDYVMLVGGERDGEVLELDPVATHPVAAPVCEGYTNANVFQYDDPERLWPDRSPEGEHIAAVYTAYSRESGLATPVQMSSASPAQTVATQAAAHERWLAWVGAQGEPSDEDVFPNGVFRARCDICGEGGVGASQEQVDGLLAFHMRDSHGR